MLEIKKLKFVDFKVQGVKGNEEERALLLSWVDVVDYE